MLAFFIILSIVLILVFVYFLLSYKLFSFIFKIKRHHKNNNANSVSHNKSKYHIIFDEEFLSNNPFIEQQITNKNNLHLKAYFLNKNSHLYLIMCHGWKGSYKENSMIASALNKELKINFLLIVQRGHKPSEGKYTTMGYYEREDVIEWMNYIKSKDKQARFILYGDSMGGTTVLNVAGECKDDKLCGVISDSAFNSIKEQIKYVLKCNKPFYLFHYFGIYLLAKIILKLSLKNDGPNRLLNKCQVPVLFIHGEKDKFVNIDNLYQNIESLNKNCTYDKYIVKDAGHIVSFYHNKEKYILKIKEFITKITD